MASDAHTIFLDLNENPRFRSNVEGKNKRYAHELKQKFPLHHFERLAPYLTEIRLRKEPEEIELIQKACDITKKAFYRVLEFVKPGVYEYEIEAEIIREFIRNGAAGHAYDPIVASGENACVLHYIENSDVCEDGELVLLDFGVEYANYASDCSRTLPVNGTFTERQLNLYNSVLHVKNEAMKFIRPGITLYDLQQHVRKVWEQEHVKLGLYSKGELTHQSSQKPLYMNYFPHGISHFMGLDVHDVGGKDVVLKPGMVLTCEPGIYIPEEGTGIRLEDDILVTEHEPVNLTKDIPILPKEIENWMNDLKK
jgi:Xaa-Pro aminopeptidase